MKILYSIIDGDVTGGNVICLQLIEESLQRGWKVVVNSPTEGKFTRILREVGVKVYYIDTRRSFRFDSALKLARVIRRENIDLVHSHTPFAGTILSRIAGKLANIPVITHAHGLTPMRANPFIRRYQLWLDSFTTKKILGEVIAVSKATKADLIQQGVPDGKIHLIYNGVILKNGQLKVREFRNRTLEGLKLSSTFSVIGQIGRIDEKKGQRVLIHAAPAVLKKFPNTIFLIVGEDFQNKVYQKKLRTLAKRIGIIDRIIFTGYRFDVMALMNIFDVFVLPSSVEGLPVVILEAMAAKKPVITTSVGGNTEVVIDGETGTIVPPEDPGALARAIIYHLENPDISKKMGERGYERVKKYFTRKKMVKKTFQVYEQVLKKRAGYV